MNRKTINQAFFHSARDVNSSQQDLMPARYSLWVQLLSMAAFTLAFVGWLNETWLMWFENPIWLNRYTEYGIILCFGIWRIFAEKNTYTRKRLIILVFMVTIFWWMIPWLHPMNEPYVGFLWGQPVFPSLHVPGTITFFLILAAVFLFGRRIICGFNCPCVGIRETVGFPFRNKTLRSKWSWTLRHSKWLFFSYYVGIMVVTQFPPNSWTVSFVGGFYLIVAFTYFGSFFIAPLVGNRFYCRYLCPYGATFGLLNHAGFYGINMDTEKCIDCQRCEQVCDMGIPVWQQGKESGRVTALEDCMGCARCIVSCPTDALEIRDVRNFFKKSLVQNGSYLLKQKPELKIIRQENEKRAGTKRTQDWAEIHDTPELTQIKQQASRCLDCGYPGCINACPLQNRIPEWLEQVAAGNIDKASELAHSTSNLPEVCGTLCPQHRLCEGACTKAKEEEDGAVTIGIIERYLVEHAAQKTDKTTISNTKNRNKKVAVIGAGPAGIACADELNKKGFSVTVYDRNKKIGGLLETGVPPFKLDKKLLHNRQILLELQGIRFQLNTDVDQTLLKNIADESGAVFLGLGAQTSRDIKLPGQQLKNVSDALTYLADVNAQYESARLHITGKGVVVLGGGDSAMDCARSAIRQGAKKVTVAYRRAEEFMRASPKEQQIAREEGIEFLFDYIPTDITGETCVDGVLFDNKQLRRFIKCDVVILALGQLNKTESWMAAFNIKSNDEGVVLVDTNGRTSNEKFYAGGDNSNGPDLIVTAIKAGRVAAAGINKDLNAGFISKRFAKPASMSQTNKDSLSVAARIMP